MSRFRPRCCIMKYETILFREKETPGYSGENHPGRPGISIPIPAQTITTFDAPGTGTGALLGFLAAALIRMEPSWETTLTRTI